MSVDVSVLRQAIRENQAVLDSLYVRERDGVSFIPTSQLGALIDGYRAILSVMSGMVTEIERLASYEELAERHRFKVESPAAQQQDEVDDRCVWDAAWIGRCEDHATSGQLCAAHAGKKCRDCESEAVGECGHTGQFVCGFPLCQTHLPYCSCHGYGKAQ